MGTEFLLLDDARRVYFCLDKFFVPPEARRQQSFDQFTVRTAGKATTV